MDSRIAKSRKFHAYIIYILLTERDVSMGEVEFPFLRVYGRKRNRGAYTRKKKNETNIPPYGLSAKAINDLLYGYKRKLFLYLTTKQIQKAIAVQKKHT